MDQGPGKAGDPAATVDARPGQPPTADGELLRQMADTISVGCTISQLDPPRFLYVSPACVRILGFDPRRSGPSPANLLAVVHPDDRERVARQFWEPSLTGLEVQSEFRIIRSDGARRWVRVTNAPVTEAGSLAQVAGTVEDITDRKLAEEAALTARAEAERANAAKNDFLSKMSHELRTPLNAVLGFAQLLELDRLTPEQHDAVAQILRGGRHLLEMINDLLDISRIESDKLEVSLAGFGLAEVVHNAVALMTPIAAARQIEIHYHPGVEAGLDVYADRRRMGQVLLNLLSNAVKYNNPGGRVDLRCRLVDGGWLALDVTDSGIGIRPEDLPRVFQPFERFGSLADTVEGTGIGLALSERLVGLMQGRLTVASSYGHGTTFTVTLATGQPTQPDSAPADRSPLALYLAPSPAGVALLQRITHRTDGWRLRHVDSLGAVPADAAAERPDLIIVDLGLPIPDVVTAVRTLADGRLTAGIPIVTVLDDARTAVLEELRVAGAEHHLTKPLDVPAVLAVLAAVTAG